MVAYDPSAARKGKKYGAGVDPGGFNPLAR
jgi:hypothetical protein